MNCNQCVHRTVCHKEYHYSDLNNVEEKCDHFLHELNTKEFPCHVGQPVWLIREGYLDGVKQLIIDDMYVVAVRCRFALKNDIIIETDDIESRIQIFLGYEDNPYREIEVRDHDFGKAVFIRKEDAEIALKQMKENHNA